MDVSLNKLREIEQDREARHTAIYGAAKSQTQLSNWTTTNSLVIATFPFPYHSFGHGRITFQKIRVLFITIIKHPIKWIRHLLTYLNVMCSVNYAIITVAHSLQPFSLFPCSVMSDSAVPESLACQVPLSMEFSSQEYWSGWPFPIQGIFPTQESNSCLCLLHWEAVSPLCPLGSLFSSFFFFYWQKDHRRILKGNQSFCIFQVFQEKKFTQYVVWW